ncbi:MAG: flgA [Rhodocyclales bacterium]|nr:flgA [Rhodocyclales bacterium]
MKKTVAALCLFYLLGTLAGPVARAASSQEVVAAVTTYLTQRTSDLPGSVSVSVKPPDERQLTLERCTQVQAFLPQGQQAWGRVTVGVRCTNGPNGTLYVSARVQVEGSYVKLARPVAGGQTIAEGDVQLEQGELTAYPADLVLGLKDAMGQTTRQALSPGQPLRNAYLQHEIGIRAGQSVRVIANGSGFSVVNRGRALNSAQRGEMIRVRLDNGQVLSGVAAAADTVDMSDSR